MIEAKKTIIMVSKEFLHKMLDNSRKMDIECDKWKSLGIDILNSSIFELSAKLEADILKEIFDEKDCDVWYGYVYPLLGTVFSKENPYLYIEATEGETIPLVWDDATFIEYMYNLQRSYGFRS